MLTQWFEMIESVSSSRNVALIISLGAAIVFACGLWRRETINNFRYDTLRTDCCKREDALLASISRKEDELAKLSREVFEVLKDTAALCFQIRMIALGLKRRKSRLIALTKSAVEGA